MIKPIPLDVLIHSVTYEEYDTNNRYGETYKPPITLDKVLVQPASNIKRSNTAEEIIFKSLLFFDCVNSSPKVTFKEKSKVTFEGETMYIYKVNPCYAFGLHHYEVELV